MDTAEQMRKNLARQTHEAEEAQRENAELRARVAEIEKEKAILLAPLVEMVEAIESGDEAGRGSEWHILARQAIDNARE